MNEERLNRIANKMYGKLNSRKFVYTISEVLELLKELVKEIEDDNAKTKSVGIHLPQKKSV